MDIRKWLDETLQPVSPVIPPKHIDFESLVRPKRPDPVATGKRRRKRGKPDTSLLDPLSSQNTPSNERKLPIEEITSEGCNSKASKFTHNRLSKSVTSTQRYARKTRRKTRLERYERPSEDTKKQGRHGHRAQKEDKKKSRCKIKRKKGEISGSDMVQSFQAKNVFGDRLTLKPLEKIGIFNNGKTSVAVKGCGLPDLVFSEMNFLQKNKGQAEPSPQQAISKQKHKNTKEGEISAFFTIAQPVLAEKNGNSHLEEICHEDKASSSRTCRRQRKQLPVINTAVPTIESTDKAYYLGFGSRKSLHNGTSYVSWSESTCEPSAIPRSVVNNDPACIANNEGDCTTDSGLETSSHRFIPPLTIGNSIGGTTERFKLSSVPRAHQEVSRSHSYPRHISSPQRLNLFDRVELPQFADTTAFPVWMPLSTRVCSPVEAERCVTPSMAEGVKSRTPLLSGSNMAPIHRGLEENNENNGAETDLHTSSSLSRVLQYCNDVFHEGRQPTALRRRSKVQKYGLCSKRDLQQHMSTNIYPLIQHNSIVGFPGVEARLLRVPNFSGPSIYEQQAQRQQLPLQAQVEGVDVNEDLLYNDQIYMDGRNGVTCDYYDWDEFPEQYEAEADVHSIENTHIAEDDDQQFASESNVVTPGFWRPHKLY